MIETQRLRLLPWKERDWEEFYPIASDPEVMRYITGGEPWTVERARQFIDGQRALFTECGFCCWRLELKQTGETAGFCGGGKLHGFDDIETGWWLARHLWGNGLATEAARAAVDDLFGRIGLPHIISVAARENRASLRIMEKLGFRFVEEVEYKGVLVRIHRLEAKDTNAATG
jgi:RimJ/RimL family protein N-acetyltransferase